jgi:2-succinyl-6-hydroxy-2,4-cyclohexadiene-1-carboxylate synthase
VLLHGFTQNARCWEPFASLLSAATDAEIVAIDLPGHGTSPALHDEADLWETASLVADVGRDAHYVGYSMGGRVALHLALEHPQVVQSLTLIGATAGIEDPVERATRRLADDRLADELLDVGLKMFLDRWLAQPLFAGLTPEKAHLQARLLNRPEGLACSLRSCGTGTQEDLWERTGGLTVPLHVVVGALDTKFAAIGKRLNGDLFLIAEAGHSAHLEQPRSTAKVAANWIMR